MDPAFMDHVVVKVKQGAAFEGGKWGDRPRPRS